MNYLTHLDIKHFKGIENLKLSNISSINIIIGDNNIGKTSILESISLLQSQNNIKAILKHISRAENSYLSKFQLFLEIFPKNHNGYKNVQINSIINGSKRELKIDGKVIDKTFKGEMNITLDNKNILNKEIIIKEQELIKDKIGYDIIKIIYITPYDHFNDGLINKTIVNIKDKEKSNIISLLKKFDSNILDFSLSSIENGNLVTTHINHKAYGNVPLFAFGDSIKKVLTLASGVINAKNGILLVDEIETAIHKNMLADVFKWLISLCKEYKVQLICTTHSLEAIDSIIIALKYNIDDLSCFRIERYDNEIYATSFSGNKLQDIRTYLGQDVR